MNKRHAFVGIAVLILLILIFGLLLLYRRSQITNQPLIEIPLGASPSPGTVDLPEGTLTNEDTFVFTGFFPEPLFTANGIIMGDFVIEEDPNQSKIRVVFTNEDSNFTIGETNEGSVNFLLQDASNLFDFVQPNQLYEIRIFQGEPKDENEQAMLDQLNQLKNDTNIEDNEYSLAPTMIRDLE